MLLWVRRGGNGGVGRMGKGEFEGVLEMHPRRSSV